MADTKEPTMTPRLAAALLLLNKSWGSGRPINVLTGNVLAAYRESLEAAPQQPDRGAQKALASLVRAMEAWGSWEDGIPEDLPAHRCGVPDGYSPALDSEEE